MGSARRPRRSMIGRFPISATRLSCDRSAILTMDVRDTPEQAELRRTARRMARELGPRTVLGLAERGRSERLAGAVRGAGWLDLRHDRGDGLPLASGVEAAIIADALARRAGVPPVDGAVVAFAPDLIGPAVASGPVTDAPIFAVDHAATGPVAAYVLVPGGDGYHLALAAADGASDGADLTRAIRRLPAGVALDRVRDHSRRLTESDLDAWTALGLALTSADIVGVLRGVLDVTVAYAKERRQYGVAIGTFQAVQHLLAEARCLTEGAFSAALYPAWAVDELDAVEARAAGRVAK